MGGNDAVLTHDALGEQPQYRIFRTHVLDEGVSITSAPADGDTYRAGETIRVSVRFNRTVTVTGVPTLVVIMDPRREADPLARYSGGSGTDTLTFDHVVASNDRDWDGIEIFYSFYRIALDAGSAIKDEDNNDALLENDRVAVQRGHKVDGSLAASPAPNSEPEFASETATRSVAENSPSGTVVGDPIPAADDADGDTLTYALTGPAAAAFAIDETSRQISVAAGATLDYETQSSYTLTVTVSDGRDASGGADDGVDDSMTVTVNVVNVDEAGSVSFDADPPQAGSALTASLSDPDGGVSGETWAWQVSADGTNWTAISGANGASYTPSDDDAGSYLRATASYADGHGAGKSARGRTASPVEPAPVTQSQATPTVAPDSPLVPDGIEPGDDFQLLFVTSITTRAESSDIADYNHFVQARAAVNTNLADFSAQFAAYISTSTVDARDNTGTTGEGVPIYWLGGEKVADDYADFYEGGWDSANGRTETGGSYTGLVWTGGNHLGTKSGQRPAGAAEVRMGDLSGAALAPSSPTAKAASESFPLYALSPVITVAQPE